MNSEMKASRLFPTLDKRISVAVWRNTPIAAALMLLALSLIAGAADGLPSSLISRLATGPDGALWAASTDAGIGRLEAGASGHVRTEEGPYRLITFDIEAHGAVLWFSHFNMPLSGSSYISRRDVSGWRQFTAADGLPKASSLTYAQADAAVDRSGAYWRGARAAEDTPQAVSLLRFDGSASRLFGLADGLPDEHVRDLAAMSVDSDDVWAAFDAGLFVWDGGAWSAADLTGLPSTALTAVAESDRHPSWIGGIDGDSEGLVGGTNFVAHGLSRPGSTWTVYLAGPDTGLPSGTIADIDSLRWGGTWIATEGGAVARLVGERWISWSAAEVMGGVEVEYLHGIVADGRGGAWVGGETAPGGPTVAHFDGTAWTQFGPEDGAPESVVFDVAIVEDCSVWFAGITKIAAFTPDGGHAAVPSRPSGAAASGPCALDALFDADRGQSAYAGRSPPRGRGPSRTGSRSRPRRPRGARLLGCPAGSGGLGS